MAGAFFAELGLPHPDHALGVGGGGHAAQTGRMLAALEPVLEAEAPDAVLVYGDTNSTLAGTLAAAKLRIPVAHVEAGLRSFDRRMPEEINRVVADHLATWCFAPTKTAVANLAHEGITAGVVEVGDLMQDLAARVAAEIRDPAALVPAADALAAAGAPGLTGTLTPGALHLRHDPPRREPRAGGAGSLARDPRGCRATGTPGHPRAASRHPGRPRCLWRRPSARREGRRAARLSDLAHPPAPRGCRRDRLRRRAARGGLARHAVPRASLDDRVGRGGGRVERADGRRRAGPGACRP